MSEQTPDDARFAPPKAEVADIPVAGAGTLELAGRGTRLLGAILDTFILIVPVMLLMWLLRGSGAFSGEEPAFSDQLLDLLAGVVTFVALNGWLLHHSGQTLGKRIVGIRIVATDGSRVALPRLLALRYGPGFVLAPFQWVYWIWALVDALCIFRADRRCLHDLIAGTIVVRA